MVNTQETRHVCLRMTKADWIKQVAECAFGGTIDTRIIPWAEVALGEGTCMAADSRFGTLCFPLDEMVERLRAVGIRQTFTGDDSVICVSQTAWVRLHDVERDCARASVVVSDATLLPFLVALTTEWLAPIPDEPPAPRVPEVHSFSRDRDGDYRVCCVGEVQGDIVRSNYSSKVLAQFDRVVEELASPKPSGRLVLLEGDPGTGKTHLVRALIGSLPDAKCILVPPNVMADLSGPEFLSALLGERGERLILILEDADDALIAREKNAAAKASLSALLNMSDGILGAALDLCIVATTNQRFDNLDRAVLRPGRLLQRLSVGPLSAAEAAACFRGLTGRARTYRGAATLAEVYEHTAEAPPKPARRKVAESTADA